MNSLNIRLLKDGEEDFIVKIHNLAFNKWIKNLGSVYGYKKITKSDVESWKAEKGQIWIAFTNEHPIAYAHCKVEEIMGETKKFKQLVFVETLESLGQSKIAVLPSFQNKGFAKIFIRKLFQYYLKEGIQTVLALAYSDNLVSTNLFSSLGFQHKELFYHTIFSEKEPLFLDSVLAVYDLKNELPKIKLNPDIKIRLVQRKDLPNIYQIFKESRPDVFGPNPTLEQIENWFQKPWGEVTLVAELEGEAVGCMEFNSEGIIGIPGVLKVYQKQGIGSTIFYHLLKKMQEKGFKQAIADTGYILKDAIKMYKRFDFNLSRELWSWFKLF